MKKRLLTAVEEAQELSLVTWMTVVCVPVITVLVFLAICASGWQGNIFTISSVIALYIAIVLYVVFMWAKVVLRYVRRLKGEKREQFMSLYARLLDCSVELDMFALVMIIDEMATLSKSRWVDVREFVFMNALNFLGPVAGLPLQIPSDSMFIAVHRTLHAGLKELPELLSSNLGYVRDAASVRLTELTDCDGRRKL